MYFLRFEGANYTHDDAGNKIWSPTGGDIFVNPETVMAFYDHTLLVQGFKIHVIDSIDELLLRMGTRGILHHCVPDPKEVE